MAGTRAAIRYAKAILSLASDKNEAEVVNNDMKSIANTISEHNDLNQMLKSAVVKSEDKKAVLIKVFPNLNPLSLELFNVLVSNKRLEILEDTAVKYSILFDEMKGKEKATVTTAVPMTSDLEIKVLAKIKELTSKSVELENIVDESILGGFILRVGDTQYNASIANKLNKLKREFTLN
ncbi:ATP synthase F1 subunit delta [Ichthyenterobacterium magnum]|uniref:ATP synthase subunit delta n=1 Tax=Ichthyenterobacterium magnum TaxID=1230530 RepID=A0A420DXD3_9FLAO|nr:ATP synthase F1 subunit delta [Ichthyenterobacterium magnum]RKE98866.1 ATP synthase F1 subcomplex delta subunit [Ichthyenterobacterium magnum]